MLHVDAIGGPDDAADPGDAAGARAADPIDQYLRAVSGGVSALVRPVQTFDGLDRVVDVVASLTSTPLLVTDLTGGGVRHAPTGGPEALDEPLLAFHTSGSTGSPKCAIYRRSAVTAHARAIAHSLGLDADSDTTYVALPPPRFAYGLSIVHSHHEAGVPVTFAAAAWGLPALAEAITGSDGPVAVYALPQHAPLLLTADVDPARVTRIIVAGGRLSGGAAASLAERFPRADLTNMYGQAELGPRLSLWHGRLADFVEGTIGRPLPGVHLRIVTLQDRAEATAVTDGTGEAGAAESPDAPVGAIRARSPYAMWRYLPPPYTEALPGPGPDEYVRTGDLGGLLPDGQLRHDGRADHVLNVAGTKVDLRAMTRLVEDAFSPVAVRITSRPARLGGDRVPVIEIVPGALSPRTSQVRRALHAEFGPLAGLCDIHLVERLTLGESGK